jgi:hypothetical protein
MDLYKQKHGLTFNEAGIGQDLVTPQQRVQQSTPQKQTPVGKVVDTVKQAGKWLAGRGGPGKEGPTYEGEYGDYSAGATNPDGTASAQRQADRERDRLEYERKQKGSKEGVAIAEKLKGLPSKKLGSARDLGKSVRKFRAQRGLEEAGTDSQWSKESDWKEVPKSKSGKPVDPRGEVTHLSDVARREAERKAAQKKNPKEVTEEGSRPRDLGAEVMLKKARAAFPIAGNDAEALALYIADKEQRDVNRLERENDEEDALIARIMDQLKKTEVDEAANPAQQAAIAIAMKKAHKKPKTKGITEGPDLINMSDLQFYKELLAVLVIPVAGLGAAAWNRAQNALKLYRAEDVITALNKNGITVDRATLGQIKPLLLKLEQAIDVDRDGDAAKELAQRIQQTVAWGKLKQAPVKPKSSAQGHDEPGVAVAQTDYQKRRQRERDVDAGKPVRALPKNPQTDYARKRAQDRKDMELGEDQDTSGVESAIIRRIMVAHTDLLMKFGPEKVMQAAEEVAYNVGDVDEIGTSDVSAYVAQVKQILGATP